VSGFLLAALWCSLHNSVFVSRRHALGTLVRVRDAMSVFEQEIELGARFVLPVNDVVLGMNS